MRKRLIRNFTFPAIARRDGLHDLYARIAFLNQSQYWTHDRLVDLQIKKLRRLSGHAFSNVPYYRELFDEAGFSPDRVSSLEDLKTLPLLDKQIIRSAGEKLIAKNLSSDKIHYSETGGTTGVKMKFYRDNACLSAKEALRFRFEQWAGWEIGESMGLVWPATVDYIGQHTFKAKLKNAFYERQVAFPAAVLDEENIQGFLSRASRAGITFIRAFPSPLYVVAQYMNQTGRCLPLKGIVSTGEPLFPYQKVSIEKAFACSVRDSYRCREIGPVAQQCSAGQGMHVNMESVIVEVIPADDLPEGQGRIVVTDLENFGMPLIRYSMDDVGALASESCSCGRSLQVLSRLNGRASDSFVTPEGRKVMAGSLVLYLVDEAPGMVGQVQVVQDRIDHLLVRMTPDPPPTDEIRDYQTAKIKQLFGPNMQVDFEIVPEISRSRSGKYQFAVSLLETDTETKGNV